MGVDLAFFTKMTKSNLPFWGHQNPSWKTFINSRMNSSIFTFTQKNVWPNWFFFSMQTLYLLCNINLNTNLLIHDGLHLQRIHDIYLKKVLYCGLSLAKKKLPLDLTKSIGMSLLLDSDCMDTYFSLANKLLIPQEMQWVASYYNCGKRDCSHGKDV